MLSDEEIVANRLAYVKECAQAADIPLPCWLELPADAKADALDRVRKRNARLKADEYYATLSPADAKAEKAKYAKRYREAHRAETNARQNLKRQEAKKKKLAYQETVNFS